ncbi:MAG TPA: ankyrin repeat domain-containing protein [Fimbriiglobus sp.]|jgi:ankyrin repeat protein|nr:ankyrin repeat domain-containing protein [Fimbriiglobus sp.]
MFELSEAVSSGDVEVVRALLDAGADIRYVLPHNYTVMIDAMHGRSIEDDEQLIPLLRLLVERGADLNAISSYGESALRVAYRVGRFDAVGLLLDSGADPAQLEWSPLHRAVALGSAEDVRAQIEAGADLSSRDWWERTPWLLSLQTGDIAKAEALLAAGATLTDRGRCGKTPLIYPVGSRQPAMVKWLLDRGVDPNETDDFGGTALIEAAGDGVTECVRLLLEAGADALHRSNSFSAIELASNVAIVRLLVDAGADLNEINGAMRLTLTGLRHEEALNCTASDYQADKHRVFGRSNPERMNFPFWKAMVANGGSAYHARERFDQGRLSDDAIWCYDRFGMSLTELQGGRVIEIAGEHEDYYDPDFCIYNDVIVHHGDGTFDIYGYPEVVFPPTDFHTATLVGNVIFIIGNLGYAGSRRYGTTPVYRLDIHSLAIEPVATTGNLPGWISRHRAKLVGCGIEVSGGKVCDRLGNEERYEDNSNTFVLDLETRTWSRRIDG